MHFRPDPANFHYCYNCGRSKLDHANSYCPQELDRRQLQAQQPQTESEQIVAHARIARLMHDILMQPEHREALDKLGDD